MLVIRLIATGKIDAFTISRIWVKMGDVVIFERNEDRKLEGWFWRLNISLNFILKIV